MINNKSSYYMDSLLLNNESVKLIAEKDLVKSPEGLKPLNKVFKSMNRHPIFIVHNKNNPEYVTLVIETNSINPLVDQASMELSSFCKSLVPTSDHSFTQLKYLFNMSKITLLNKKPFDGLRAPIALEILKESELVIYFNSLIGRFEIYSKNYYYKNKFSGSNIIDAFYSNPDFLTLDILENILTRYILKNKLLPNHTSNILRSELEDIFRLGYIYIINKEQELGYDFRQQQNNFSYDRENTNNECYYVFSKDRLPPLDRVLYDHYLEEYVSVDNTELNYDIFKNFYEPVQSATFKHENRLLVWVKQAF